MGNIDDISLDLPAPRDDEPPTLRTDIIDELTDHLQSAFHRELHTRTTDPDPESAARRRVLRRFGNPSTIARRLWWDAMKERIMNQRLTIAVLVVLVLMSAGMFVISWQSLGANREMVRESHELNRELITELRNLADDGEAAAPAPAQPPEWNRLQVRCVYDSEDGAPAEGIRVSVRSASDNTNGVPPGEATTDADGIVDFGHALYGQYRLELETPDGMLLGKTIGVRPGQDRLVTIVTPREDAFAEVQLNVTPRRNTDEVDVPRIWYRCEFEGWEDLYIETWSYQRSVSVNVLVSPEGQLFKLLPDSFTYVRRAIDEAADAEESTPRPQFSVVRLQLAAGATPTMTLQLPPMRYALQSVTALMEEQSAETTALLELMPHQDEGAYSERNYDRPRAEFAAVWNEPQTWEIREESNLRHVIRVLTALGDDLVPTALRTASLDWSDFYPALIAQIACPDPQSSRVAVRNTAVVGATGGDEDSTIFVALTPEERRLLNQLSPASQIEHLTVSPAEETPDDGEQTDTLVPQLRVLLETLQVPDADRESNPGTDPDAVES